MTEAVKDRSFRQLEALSFLHSGIYFALLACWIFEGPALLRNRLGWAHGLLWIGMTILVIFAARKAIVSFRLAVLVAVIGGLGPFAGTAGFILEGRQRRREGSVRNCTSSDGPQ
jgi:hypothetical protein